MAEPRVQVDHQRLCHLRLGWAASWLGSGLNRQEVRQADEACPSSYPCQTILLGSARNTSSKHRNTHSTAASIAVCTLQTARERIQQVVLRHPSCQVGPCCWNLGSELRWTPLQMEVEYHLHPAVPWSLPPAVSQASLLFVQQAQQLLPKMDLVQTARLALVAVAPGASAAAAKEPVEGDETADLAVVSRLEVGEPTVQQQRAVSRY